MKNSFIISFFLVAAVFHLDCFSQTKQKQVITPYYDYEIGLYGYKDSLLNMAAIPAKYQFADEFINGVARVQENEKWGFISFSGKPISPIIFDNAENMSEGLAAVQKGKNGDISTILEPKSFLLIILLQLVLVKTEQLSLMANSGDLLTKKDF